MIDFDDEQTVIKDFRQWLTTKRPDEEYQYNSTDRCAFAQYLKDRGHDNPSVTADSWELIDQRGDYHSRHTLPTEIANAVVAAWPRTFGAVAYYMDLHA